MGVGLMRMESRFSEEELKRRILAHITVARSPRGGGSFLSKEQMIGNVSGNTFWVQKICKHRKISGQRHFAGKILTEDGHTVIEGRLRFSKKISLIGGLLLLLCFYFIIRSRNIFLICWYLFWTLFAVPLSLMKYATEESDTLLFVHQVAQADEM